MRFDLTIEASTIINDVSTIDNIGQFSIAIGNLIKGDSGKSPYIDSNTHTWWEYNDVTKVYEDTGIAAKSVDIYNITNEIPLGAGLFYTLSTAIAATPVANRKKGLLLMFESAAGVWETYQFKGVIGDWSLLANWDIKVPNKKYLDDLIQEVKIINTKQDNQIKEIEELLSTSNLNQNTTNTSTGYEEILLPKTAANAGMEIKLEGQTAENIVNGFGIINGDSIIFPTINGNKYYVSIANDIIIGDGNNYTATNNTGVTKNIIVVNLTNIFTSGNEPIKSTCDKIFADYFKGVKSFIPTGRIRSADQNFYLNAPVLRSNGVVKDEIRKGTHGYELVKRVGVGSLGTELITNAADREFSSDTGFWTKPNSVNISDGTCNFNMLGNFKERFYRRNLIQSGKFYNTKIEVKEYTSGSIGIYDNNERLVHIPNNVGIHSKFLNSTGDSFQIIGDGVDIVNCKLDNINVKEVIPTDGIIKSDSTFTELSNGEILYTLETPVITPISYSGILNSHESGTIYHEPVVADASVYDTNIEILMTDYPISTIETIIKHENGIDTYLDINDAVIALDGLSFTHPDLVSGDLVLFTYFFDLEKVNGLITATYYDSRYVIADSVNSKFYKWSVVSANGVPSINLIEV